MARGGRRRGGGAGTRPPFAWRLFNSTALWLLRTLFGWRVRTTVHDDVPPPDRPMLLVFNHTSQVDGFVVAHTAWKATGHWGQPLVKEEVFDNPVVGVLGRAAGAIPVGRDSAEERSEAYDAAIERLRGGATVIVAPEGTITHDGSLLPMRHGAARMALEAGCDVLVVTTFGAQRAFSPIARTPHRDVLVDVAIEVLVPRADDDPASLTGRIAATITDRHAQLVADHPVGGPHEPWWPPYANPAEPSGTARESLAKYRQSMADSIQQARDRADHLRAEAADRATQAREQVEHAAGEARNRLAGRGDGASPDPAGDSGDDDRQ